MEQPDFHALIHDYSTDLLDAASSDERQEIAFEISCDPDGRSNSHADGRADFSAAAAASDANGERTAEGISPMIEMTEAMLSEAVDVRHHSLLTLEDEIALGERIQAGDKEALGELVQHNLRLVYKIARKHFSNDPANTFDDLVSEGMVGLLHAAQRYEPGRGLRFSTYATYLIKKKISHYSLTSGTIKRSAYPQYARKTPAAIRNHALRQAPVVRLDAPLRDRRGDDSENTLADIVADDCDSVEDQVFESMEFERILRGLKLNERGEAIIRDWLASDLSRREVQKKHGVSQSWIYMILSLRKERLMPRQSVKPNCIEPDCQQPKYVDHNGKKYARCEKHQQEFWNAANKARRRAAEDKEAAPVKSRYPKLVRMSVGTPQAIVAAPNGHYPTEPAISPPLDFAASDLHLPAASTNETGCTCDDCVYREVVDLLAAKNPRVIELVRSIVETRRIRDELGI